MRNKSIIVDLFQGQFKSTLICPVPYYSFLSLSLTLFLDNSRCTEVLTHIDHVRPVHVPLATASR